MVRPERSGDWRIPMPREVKQKTVLPCHTGRFAEIFEEDDLARLLEVFAKRYAVDRSRVNRILSRQLRASEAIAKVLGLRRVYIAD